MRRAGADVVQESGKRGIRRHRFADQKSMKLRVGQLENLRKALPFCLAEPAIFPVEEALENPIELAHAAPASPPQPPENGVRHLKVPIGV